MWGFISLKITTMFDFIDFLAYQAIEDAHEEYEQERENR